MAITIDDIYDKEFALKGGGYDRDDVDQFLDEICDEMTNMQEKITSLESDLQKAQDELKAAREAVKPAPVAQAQPVETPIAKTSSTLESILLSAQRLADEEVEENVPPFRLAMETQEIMPDFVIPKNKDTAYLDADKVVLPLTVRKWRQGDKFIPFGMKGKKKISDYLTDRKFSLFQKENQYVVCSAGQIVWLVGERSDDRFRVTEDTKRVLIIRQWEDK